MSPQLLELLFLAGVAFIVINKLIATLGTTNSNESRSKSFFGEKNVLKDVTPRYASEDNLKTTSAEAFENSEIQNFLVSENQAELVKAIGDIQNKLPNFKPANFIKSSKNAFQMILAAVNNAPANLAELVDKRYIDKLKELAPSYGNLVGNINNLEAKISEAYSFGNSLFVKVLFSDQNFKEEWTFSRNILQNSPIWYLNNIDKI